MEQKDTYKTVARQSEGLYKEKGSKFIALAYPVSTEEEVKEILAELRKHYHDARHHCYAYVIGYDGQSWRANDDGEPSSTAGKPIYGQILSRELTNTLVVVIRYFGGTKLGVSGLINAYKVAASEALDANELVERTVNDIYSITFAYPATNEVMRLIKEEELPVLAQQFDSSCAVTVGIRQGKISMVLDKIDKIDSAVAEYLRTD
ncbi:IMPACT family protein [Perlabentimonas gracilis]|uniref:IMPACT family protein n=1 Tax=Perlabentimonas gracilis TaxID=2715279 RepID=UPI001407265C|nr:YigZ family protein [Perlabentimonas gracilis]NHB68753.1 YigZ family protein [Perlabentimonas gracilis]